MNLVYTTASGEFPAQGIQTNLYEFNQSQVPGYAYQGFAYTLQDNGESLGGIECRAGGGWLYIDSLWVEPLFRGRGAAGKLLVAAEKKALELGCRNAWLYTYSFQAPEFYEKFGYQIFGQLDDFFDSHKQFFMKKKL